MGGYRMMYCTPNEIRKARKQHQCTNCCEMIEPGESYIRWTSFDDAAFRNKMHLECHSDLAIYGPFEYTQFSGERPKKEIK